MTVRLTRETATIENCDNAAVTQAGLLGTYNFEEFEQLSSMDSDRWTFEWTPFKMDKTVGRIKMRPLCQQSVKLLDKGRAIQLIERHKWLKLHRAIGFIKVIKRHPSGMNKKVQDFLLKYWKNKELQHLTNDNKKFTEWVKANSDIKLNAKETEAIFKLIDKVVYVMSKSGKPNNRVRKEVSST